MSRLRPVYSCSSVPDYRDDILFSSYDNAANEILASPPLDNRERLSFGGRRATGGRGAAVPLPYISVSYISPTQTKRTRLLSFDREELTCHE